MPVVVTPTEVIQPIVEFRRRWSAPWQLCTSGFECVSATANLSPEIPSAIFRWRYGKIFHPDIAEWQIASPQDLIGCFVRLSVPATEDELAADPEALNTPIWHGIITDAEDSPGSADSSIALGDQTFTARGLEILLERTCIYGAWIVTGGNVRHITRSLGFNVSDATSLGGTIKGNRSLAKYTADSGMDSYVFAEAGDPWTVADIIEYLLARFAPPRLNWYFYGAGDANLQLAAPVMSAPVNIREALNRLVDRRRGHAWNVGVDDAEFYNAQHVGDPDFPAISQDAAYLRIHRLFAEDVTGSGAKIAKAPTTRLLDVSDAKVVIKDNGDFRYDRITVRGSPILLVGTFDAAAGDIVKGWSAAQETAYESATDEEREAPEYEHVFRSFKLAWNHIPGGPKISASGTILPGETAYTFLDGKTIARALPFNVADDDPDAANQYYAPFAWVEVPALAGAPYVGIWNLEERTDGTDYFIPNISLCPMDGEMGVELVVKPNHELGLNHITDEGLPPHIDWQTLLLTVAWYSDEVLSVSVDVGEKQAEIARELVLDFPQAQCWYMLEGTVLNTDASGAKITSAATTIRNDFQDLQAIAAFAKAWYGTPHSAITCQWQGLIYEYAPGQLISDTTDRRSRRRKINTPVSRVKWDFEQATTVLQTDFIELDFTPTSGKKSIWPTGDFAR